MWNNGEIAMMIGASMCIIVLGALFGIEVGERREYKRLYEKCLMKSDMVYSKAAEFCRNEVK